MSHTYTLELLILKHRKTIKVRHKHEKQNTISDGRWKSVLLTHGKVERRKPVKNLYDKII